jgi:mannose-6-phosphate isomerase-like protein (cupin superfamily)|tara:strand:+ start:477 stop:1163 length:687 start_codon:yes stop_codon:yes gene_type:complete
MKNNDKQYDKKIVTKPWGYEYVAYREKNKLAVTCLNIYKGKSTSLHCHPLKKTGFILLEGTAKIQLGLWKSETKIYKAPSKLMIRTGLFHSIKAISTNGLKALEFETPVKKNDLVRYQDKYGRKSKPYEGKNYIKPLKKNDIIFKKPKYESNQNYKVGKLNISLQVHKNFKNIINKKNSNIFAIIGGKVVDNKNRSVLSIGDIIKTGTFKKLSKIFKIKNFLTVLSVF